MLTLLRRCAALCSFIILAGCAPMSPQDPKTFDASLQAAVKQAEQGQIDLAVASLNRLGQRNPERVEPWAYIAKIRFDEKEYGLAIVAAQEALSRDESDAGAKILLAKSAMYLSADGIEGLKGNALFAETTRVQAQALAQSLRKTYGDEELFPVKRKPKRNTRPAVPKPVDPGQTIGGSPLAPVISTENRGGAASPNPFGSLMH